MTRLIKPELATLTDKPFDRKGWIFEIKWDGFRTLADIKKDKVNLYSRNLLPFNEKFPEVAASLKKIKKNMLLDGEVVVLDKQGKSHFQLLQNYLQNNHNGQLVYYVFDILFLDGRDLRSLPLSERKKLLQKNLPRMRNIKISDHIEETGIKFFQAAKKRGLEGIVAKDLKSPYRSGRRTDDWLKIKISQEQEAVIGGFTAPRGSRKKFGALVLGVYERGKFVYIGHTGGGFNDLNLKMVHDKLLKLKTKESPFVVTPKTNAPATWVKPKLVCQVKFEEWTGDGHMRQPIFLGMRMDKAPKEVRREIPNHK
ncbi:MAG TPA: non-homologous end-joining DNA ligase [Patescibacteria group bacterium]|nr:non-homologous end-joining DNA ligase [Patescibacteria group bacterium]